MNETTRVSLPAIDNINQVLMRVKALASPSEMHGMMCGLLCVFMHEQNTAWLHSLYQLMDVVEVNDDELSTMLLELYNIVIIQLRDLNYGFQLLIPDDNADLKIRLEALSYWCCGFVRALGSAPMDLASLITEEMIEALQDLQKIATVNIEDCSGSEEEEIAYTDIYEYVRMAVILLYNEFILVAHEEHAAGSLH